MEMYKVMNSKRFLKIETITNILPESTSEILGIFLFFIAMTRLINHEELAIRETGSV